jgi:hypothetical protein
MISGSGSPAASQRSVAGSSRATNTVAGCSRIVGGDSPPPGNTDFCQLYRKGDPRLSYAQKEYDNQFVNVKSGVACVGSATWYPTHVSSTVLTTVFSDLLLL